MVGLFSGKKTSCSVCNKEISHAHKPKRSWNVQGSLCADCYVDLMEKNFDNEDKCTLCGTEPSSFNLWKPKKEWGVTGWLCKPCFDQKEKQDNDLKNFCCSCGGKIGLFSYSPRKEWAMSGHLCKRCWNSKTRT